MMVRPHPFVLVACAFLTSAGCYIYEEDPFPETETDPGLGDPRTYPPAPPAPPYHPAPPAPPAPPYRPAPPDAPSAPGAGAPGDGCPGPTVDRWKELLIIDPSVVTDRRARNDAADATWSFRRRLEELAGAPATAGDLAWSWLNTWRWSYSVASEAGQPRAPRVAVTPRPSVDSALTCPWLRQSPANGCTPTCTSCSDRRLDLAHAPFRLIAIVNRIDLGGADSACGRDGGELRWIYTAVDPETGSPLPFTVIFEHRIALPSGQDRRSWAQAWRALGRRRFGPDFNAGLDALIGRAMGAATLLRVRTNEVALGEPLGMPWEMRQFVPLHPERGGVVLEPTAATHTPRLALDGTDELATFLEQNRRAILDGDNLLPPDMLAGSALLDRADFRWDAPGADPEVLDAFNGNTCNGCHGGRGEGDDLQFQHVGSPAGGSYYTPGPARVSRYLHDPSGGDDELGRRAHLLEEAACGTCGGYP